LLNVRQFVSSEICQFENMKFELVTCRTFASSEICRFENMDFVRNSVK
jgi:hypothetical protein